MKKVRILQVGYRHDHARQTFNSIMRLSDHFEIVGIADENVEGAKKTINNAPAYYSIEEALKLDIDAVAIECEEESATKYALMFAERGIHVHLDKPGSQNIADFHRLIDIVKNKNLVLQMGYMYRFNPQVQKALLMAKNGELGEIFSVEAQMSVRHTKEKREWLGKHKGGMLYFLGCHLIDLILLFCGEPKEIISLNCQTGTDEVDSTDLGFVVFKYDNGVSFVKSCASEFNGFARRQLVVTGSLGTVEIKPLEIIQENENQITNAYTTLEKDKVNPWSDKSTKSSEFFNRYDNMMRDFALCVAGEKTNKFTPDYEKLVFDTIMKCCGVTK